MTREPSVSRGIIAGIAGGIFASWAMNLFMAGLGQTLEHALQSPEEEERQAIQSEQPKEDATMKTADAIVSTATGGRHLSWEGREKGGPVVHYAFGGLMGGIYGGLAEIFPAVRSGFGTAFATALFSGADLIAVPVLQLGPSPSEESVAAEASPLAAHLVYGVSTELVRRILRSLL